MNLGGRPGALATTNGAQRTAAGADLFLIAPLLLVKPFEKRGRLVDRKHIQDEPALRTGAADEQQKTQTAIINVGDLTQHLRTIDPSAETFIFYAIDHQTNACFHHTGRVNKRTLRWINDQQSNGCSIYVAAQAMSGHRRLNSEVARFRVVFADFDNGLPASRLPLDPFITETSSGRYQAQWPIDADGQQLTEDEWRGMGRRLAQDFGADPNAMKPAQGVRLAGTQNAKPDRNGFRVRIVNESADRYSAATLLAAFPPLPDPNQSLTVRYEKGQRRATFDDQMARRHRAYFDSGFSADVAQISALQPGSRNDALYRCACRWGRYVHHKIVARNEFVDRLLVACEANHLLKDDGQRKCLAEINNGLKKAAHDRLDPLPERPRPSSAPAANAARADNEQLEWPEITSKGKPVARSQANIAAFLGSRGVTLRRNVFSLRDEVGIDGETSALDDALLRQLRLEADAMGLTPSRDYFDDVVQDLARRAPYHPLHGYLDGLSHDGKARLDSWLVDYAGAKDTPFNRAVGRCVLIAAVRRVRHPGCKFDTALVLEGKQGGGKSSLIKALAGEDWFSDSLQVGADPKEVIEHTSGKWILELAELAGIGKKGRERVKAFLSRSTDRAALKYARLAADVPRQFIVIGTTNSTEYLDDPTGNRRIWPVRCNSIDIRGIRRDRDQLWAEASIAEAAGESVELPASLWEQAANEQSKRLTNDPWFDRLEPVLDNHGKPLSGLIAKEDIWRFLKVDVNAQDPHKGRLLTEAMARHGWVAGKRRRSVPGEEGPGRATPCFVKESGTGEEPRWIKLNPGFDDYRTED